jgi:hypothetical protein
MTVDPTLVRQIEAKLIAAISADLPSLESLLERCSGHWGYEDAVYRFYHQSFKVYALQHTTIDIVARLQALAPDRPLNQWFMQIVREGTGKEFGLSDNANWLAVTRPILEAFFHARYFLEMVCRYGKELHSTPEVLPSGWAAVLSLFDLR